MESKENRIKRLALFCEENEFMDTSTIDDFYQLEIKRETNDIKGRYQLALFLLSTFFVGVVLIATFGRKDYCTPDNSRESKIVQNMQLKEVKLTAKFIHDSIKKHFVDSIATDTSCIASIHVVSHLDNIPTQWTIIDGRGNIKYQPKKSNFKITITKIK